MDETASLFPEDAALTPSASKGNMRNRTAIHLLLILALICSVSCKKKEKGEPGGGVLEKRAEEAALSGTVVGRLPADALGFVYIDTRHPAYQKLSASPWGTSDIFFSSLGAQEGKTKKLFDAAARAGLDVRNKDARTQLFKQIALFLVPEAGQPDVGAAFGAVFLADGVNLSEKIPLLTSELGKEGFTVGKMDLARGVGIVVTVNGGQAGNVPPAMSRIYFAAKDQFGVFCNSEAGVKKVLETDGSRLPEIVKSDKYKQAVQGLPPQNVRYALGFVDVSGAVNTVQDADEQKSFKKAFYEKVGLDAVAVGSAMDETPSQLVRFLPAPSVQGKETIFSKINVSSTANLLPAVYGTPLLFISIDGATVSNIVKEAVPVQAQAQAPQLALLDSIKRIGLAVRIAPLGRSFLPLPDMMVLLDTAKPEEVKKQLEMLVNTAAGNSPVPPGEWREKTIDGLKVRSLTSPLGLGVSLASKGNLVAMSSTELDMKTALAGGNAQPFAVPAADSEKVFKAETAFNLFVDFEGLATLVDNLGGVLTIYAPEASNSAKPFQQASIDAMRKAGMLFARAEKENNGVINVTSYYRVRPPQGK